MRAVVLEEYGGPEVLKLKEIPDQEPGRGEVRVEVRASALNCADIMQRIGQYPPPGTPEYEIPGLEVAGVVDKLGPAVSDWQIGDRVFGLLPGGDYAEQVLTHERMLMAIPENLTFEEAAAIPEVFFTAYDALIDKADFQAGDIVLIHAGGESSPEGGFPSVGDWRTRRAAVWGLQPRNWQKSWELALSLPLAEPHRN